MYPALSSSWQNIPDAIFSAIWDRFEYTVALPAPSLYSQFNNVRDNDILLTALTLMGFDDVFEVSAGAEIVSELSRTYINEHPELHPLISTACPTIERLIRVRFPGLIPHLLHCFHPWKQLPDSGAPTCSRKDWLTGR